ncbi:MAG TPA: phosphoribosylanthranilate isomerase [Methanocellaceae archaeon]|jgi:phosphoribosylanthranilate isomerase
MRVKICGVRTVDDALKCAHSGADAIGMLLARSPRRISIEDARDIARRLPPFVMPVIVMMPEAASDAIDAALRVRPGAVQLQGDEPPEMLERIRRALPGVRLIKAVHMGEGDELAKARSYEGFADALLLDTMSPNRGGSGVTHDWNLSRNIISSTKTPVILAGGLKPSNVADAIKAARPYAVDVASGVENSDRAKDIELVRAFIKNAKGALNGSEFQ